MTRAALALALPLLLSACTSDPCDGKGPMCISVRAEGQVPALDRIHLTATVNGGAPLSASNSQGPISLPVRFAVILPPDTSGSVGLGVEGVVGDAVVASGSGAVTVPPSGQKITITLTPGSGGSDGSADGGGDGGADLACTPGSVSLCAATDCGLIPDPAGCGMIDCGACQALSIDKPLALGGDTLFIEGKFSGTTTVSFPGSAAPVVPTTVGPARLAVVVPADATQGLLHVTSNGSTTGGLLFHRAPYTPSIGTFRLDYEQPDLARGAPAFAGRSGFSLTRVGDFVYAAGGVHTGPGPVSDLDSVDRALINADGTLGAFVATSNKLLTAGGGHAALAIGDRLFILGGAGATVATAQVGATGVLGPFSDTGVMLQRSQPAVALIGSSVYVFGGADMGGTAQSTILRAPVHTDGTLGAFTTLSAGLVEPLASTAACVRAGRVYLFGGVDGSGMATSNVESAPINPDGTLGGFIASGNLSQARSFGQCLTLDDLGGAIYVYGGSAANGTPIATVEKASISGTGGISGFFTQTATLTFPRFGVRGLVVGSNLYVGGGSNSMGFVSGNLEHASLDGSGNLGAFATTTVAQTTTRFLHAAAVIGNWLYLIGGDPGPVGGTHALLASVERAPIAADGSLGAFTNLAPGVSLKTARAGHALAISGGYLYVLGGETDTAGTPTTSVERAAIDQITGTIGNFDVFTDGAATNIALSVARLSPAAWISGGTLYVAGGHGAGGAVQSIDQTSFQAGGTVLGQFAAASFDLAVAREHFRVAQLGTNTYALGGLETGGPSANVYTSMNSATFATSGALLVSARADYALALVGDYLYAIGGRDTAPIASIVRSAVSSSNGLATFGAQGGLPAVVSQAATASAGDWLYVLGGVDSVGARATILGGPRN